MPKIKTMQERLSPLLTNFAQSYQTPNYINRIVCPPISVIRNVGEYQVTKNGAFVMDDSRAQNAKAKSIDFKYYSDRYVITEHALSTELDIELIEEAQEVPGGAIEVKTDGVKRVDLIIETNREKRVADIYMGTAYYDPTMQKDLTAGDNAPWTDVTESDPTIDISQAKEAVRAKTGMNPNSIVLGYSAFVALRKHPVVRALYNSQITRGYLTIEQLKELFEFENIIIGNSVYNVGTEDAPILEDFWGGAASICNIPSAAQASMGIPVLAAMFENNRRTKVLEVDTGETIRIILKRFNDLKHISGFNAFLLNKVVGE